MAPFPLGDLINVGGTLYGTTQFGGGTGCSGGVGCGTVFKVTPRGAETVLYSFKGGSDGANPEGGLINVLGVLYGTTYGGGATRAGCAAGGCGTVFRVTLSGVEHILHSFTGGSDGANPIPRLVIVGGTLYGTTTLGGGATGCEDGCGTVFQAMPLGAERVLYSFQGGSDGANPSAGLVNVGGILYGTTQQGGGMGCGGPGNGCGTVFKVTP
jgi:uncharacterized repeat protein (TIGR03803 family)